MLCGENGFFALSGMGMQEVQAKEVTEITAIDYFDAANGGEQTKSGVRGVNYGFVMPKFNGKPSQELSLSDVEGDLDLLVDVDGTVIAVQAGTAVITVTTIDGAKTAECSVTVTEEQKAVDPVITVKPSEPDKSGETEKPTQPVTKSYKVTFKSAGGSKVSTQTIKEGANVKKPKNPTRKGYKFAGWYVGKKASVKLKIVK